MRNELHLKAPGNWINDPNGFIYYKGRYHLFYQYFPYGTRWGTMHWGHAVSDNLIDWEHLGIALFPTKPYDRNGVFSGSALEKDGKMNVYYTAVVYGGENKEDIHIPDGTPGMQSQAMIVSDDGITFDNYNGKKHIIPAIENEDIGCYSECRDPKVWKSENEYRMVLGSTHNMETGVLLIYKSYDAENWEYLNRFEDKNFGYMLECPDLFKVDDKWILMCSPMGNTKDIESYESQCIIRPVKFNPETGDVRFENLEHKKSGNISGISNDEDVTPKHFLDYGMEIYAPQSNLDECGRRVVISWVRMPGEKSAESNSAAGDKPWNGMMTLPRVIEVLDGVIYTRVHPNVRDYFELAETEDINIPVLRTDITDFIMGRKRGSNIQVRTRISKGDKLDINGIEISISEGCIVVDRSRVFSKYKEMHMISRSPYVGDSCELEIYEEPDIIEIYINDGQYVITNVK